MKEQRRGTADLAHAVTPGETIGIDLREEALTQGRTLAQGRDILNVTFQGSLTGFPGSSGEFTPDVCRLSTQEPDPSVILSTKTQVGRLDLGILAEFIGFACIDDPALVEDKHAIDQL